MAANYIPVTVGAPQLDISQLNTFRSYVTMLGDQVAKDEIKLKAAQELSEHFEVIVQSSAFPSFLEHLIKIFLKFLQEGEPQFISENTTQHVRKLMLEMIHRIPCTDALRPYVKPIISLTLKLLRTDNEENVLVCLRIIIELHKHFRPPYNPEIQHFLTYVKDIYIDLPKHLPKIFEPSPQIRVKDLKELNFEQVLSETFTTKTIHVERVTENGAVTQAYNLLPRGVLSLKVFQELPIIVVLIYQIYKASVHQEVSEYVPLIMSTIQLQPSPVQRTSTYFNKEIFVDFMGAQIKTLSFLAYIVRIYQEAVLSHSSSVVKGVLQLMQLCPKEAANLRKELLVAARHIFATELRIKFIPVMDKLFDDDLLIGRGVTLDSIKPLAYSTLADLAHHLRASLNLDALEKAAVMFSKNVHDETLATSIQTMSCKILLNLVDCIRQHSENEPVRARVLLIKLLRVFTMKFQTIAKIQLPLIMQKWKSFKNDQQSNSAGQPSDSAKDSVSLQDVPASEQASKLSSIGFPPPVNLNVVEYRNLVKTLVGGVKTITWGCVSCKSVHADNTTPQMIKFFQPHELLIYIDLVYYALEALDIYTINIPNIGPNAVLKLPGGQTTRNKEEKEVLEHFSGIFLMMSNQNFQEIFSTTIDYMVERIYKNSALQVVANSFLANPSTSSLFATVLVEYLLGRMEEMGSNLDRSNLYLRLFKLVFGSVSLFPSENEHMLRPHLHNIVNRSMELAMTAKEPYNYFLLLRALFRSIGGGSHDLLYQEFLPLLPNLLEGLNRLQTRFHKQCMKDLFIELCLTVPVRLSSLLPYLPLLMDPLVSALNGSPTLISQGLRTLELCVDNLQPDFLYNHIQPVRGDLMQALWRTLRNHDSTALVAFRVLGKFGGGNRKIMTEPQRLTYNDKSSPPPTVVVYFQDAEKSISFPMDKIIQAALQSLSSNTTDTFYRKQSWEVIKCFLAASINLNDDKRLLLNFFMHPSFTDGNIGNIRYKCQESEARQAHQSALTAMLVAAATKELRESVFPVMVAVVRHYTMVAIAQQAGPFPSKSFRNNCSVDPHVLIDALAVCMGHEEKELCKPGQLCIGLILETATNIMGNKERACRLPLMQYLAERMASLCYERPWYAKMGGCKALKCFYDHMAIRFLYQNMFLFLKAFMFVLMDLAGEVSNGVIEMALTCLEKMLRICMVPLEKDCKNEELIQMQKKAMYEVIHELVCQITSPNTFIRNGAMSSLKLIAELQGKTVTEIMEPHRDVIPPKKHFIRLQPVSTQIGLMDGNAFCMTLEPKLFTIDWKNEENNHHKIFINELVTLVEAEDSVLAKLECYKNVNNLIPLKKSALGVLAACHYIPEETFREKIILILFKILEEDNTELQEAAFTCMQKFISGFKIDKEAIHKGMRPLLLTLGDYRNLTLNGTKRLLYLTQLFPSMFNEKLCEQLLQHIQKMLEISIASHKGMEVPNFLAVSKTGDYEQKIYTLIGIFHQIPAASSKFIDSLCQLVLQTGKSLMIEASCPYREPLFKFLLRYPNETINLFLNDINVTNAQWNRFMIYMLKHKDGLPFRTVMQHTKSARLVQLIHCSPQQTPQLLNEEQCYEARRQSVMIIHTLMEFDDRWLSSQMDIVNALKLQWQTNLYKTCTENIVCDLWHLIGKILLFYFSHNTTDIDLLFQLLRALCVHFIPDFHFLRDFLQNTVAQNYTVDWKRKAFFLFVENFNNTELSEELKAKILTTVLIPCFAVSFDKGEGNKLIGAPPAPYQEDENNVVSVFISKVFDPEKPFANDDGVRIALLQFACLLVERASPHIHDGDANNKRQGNKLRRLMTFAWPCLLSKNCVDPTARYHGHLLLSHIIARLAIHKKIVLQVFHSLLKGHALEARPVVRQALEVLTPAMPLRMEDGNTMLTHWTKKIIVEEGHSMQQLFHILQLIVRHYKVYFPVRHHLILHIISYMQRLGFPTTSSIDYRKLAVELADVVIKWELHRQKEEFYNLEESDCKVSDDKVGTSGEVKRLAPDDSSEKRKKLVLMESKIQPQSIPTIKLDDNNPPIDKIYCDAVLNFLIRLACQINEPQPTPGVPSQGESLSRRCMVLLKMATKSDVWPRPFDLKLGWIDKLLASVETPQANLGNICIGLEFLTYSLSILTKDQILETIKPIQRGLSFCVKCQNTRVIRLMHAFLSKLMQSFPPNSNHKQDAFELLYTTVSKMILEGLAAYEKASPSNPSHLFGTIMILKACCTNNQNYIDIIMLPFMKLLNKLTKDHLSGVNSTSNTGQIEGGSLSLEILILSLDLIKNRIVVMSPEIRKLFIGNILVGLIEKSNDSKIIMTIVKMMEDWIVRTGSLANLETPTLREKSVLLVKLMRYIEKRFSDDQELYIQYLELINYIFRDNQLKNSELTSQLEAAFLAGLRFNQPSIRSKFVEIFDKTIKKRLYDRLLYIVSSHAWDSISPHYWIKQCIELLVLTASSTKIQNTNASHLLPSISSVLNSVDPKEIRNFESFNLNQTIVSDNYDTAESNEDIFDIDLSIDPNLSRQEDSEKPVANRQAVIRKLISKQCEFLEENKNVRTENLLISTAQLCHTNIELAEGIWLDVFPRLWSILSPDHQQHLSKEFVAFLSSGTQVIQKDCQPNALNTFVEALTHCQPPIYIPPNLITYLGKAHNLWHRMTLMLEEMTSTWSAKFQQYEDNSDIDIEYNVEYNPMSPIYDSLSQMYSALHEEDMWAGLWLKYAKYSETNTAIAYEQMGFFEEAQGAYDLAMTKFKQEVSNGPAPIDINSELLLWENHWIRCAKELNQWDILLDYAQSNKEKKSYLIMESAWRVPDWNLMKQALIKVEQTSPKLEGYKVNLYRGFLAILNQEDQQLTSVERYVELASSLCMREWRRLPHIVSHIHLPYLQAAQQIMELQEACQIHQGLIQCRNSSLHDMKAVVKTWKNRFPVIADDLSYWSDIFTWRQHHYQVITQHLELQPDQGHLKMIGVHASAQAIIHFGKIARKHNLTGVCQEMLSRIYTIPSVPVVDCFQKIRQQVKCSLQIASVSSRVVLKEALEIIEPTNLNYFSKEMTAEFYAMKGLLHAQIGNSEEANKAFSASIQLHDGITKAWALWGDYLEALFTSHEHESINIGTSALTAFLHACRHQNESKARKYLAKVLWLLSYDDANSSLLNTLEKYSAGIPPSHWLPWIPQLLRCLVQYEGTVIINLLNQVGRMCPQPLYFSIKTLYLTLRFEQLEKLKNIEQVMKKQTSQQHQQAVIKATPSMTRCSRVMQVLCEIHPTIINSLEGIVDQMIWFRENWYEEVLRRLRQGLQNCYAIAFENRSENVAKAAITPHTLQFVNKLVSTFGIGIENTSSTVTSSIANLPGTPLARRAQTIMLDPMFQKMKEQFTNDLDFSQPDAMNLHNLIKKLKKWIKILEKMTMTLPKSFLIEEKCRFLSNFNQKTAEIELPGEFLLPLPSQYHIRIDRFMPRVEIVQKHNTAARRLYIRGTNGKLYPYLVVNDSGLGEARKEERVLQLLRMFNTYLAKQKETSRRFLNITVPKVVPVSPLMRLVEDNPASISLLDIYKKDCNKRNVEHETPIARYYQRLIEVQARGYEVPEDILQSILHEVQRSLVPKTILKNWALNNFESAADYWQFRKMFTLQLSLACVCEHVLHLTRLNADMMYMHQDSGLMNISYFKFNINPSTGELEGKRPVPFRLTPNLTEYLSPIGINGPLKASIIATSRCLVYPNFKLSAILKVILSDEIIYVYKKRTKDKNPMGNVDPESTSDIDMMEIISVVNEAVAAILLRLNDICYFDKAEMNKIEYLIKKATCPSNLSQMDPAWGPWL